MKTKRITGKLNLSKETVANLDVSDIGKIKGGFRETWEQSLCIPCTYPYNTCNGCVSTACTQVNTCGCPTGATCYTCPPDPCV